ncbi:major facilitator superfamily domain-containing protein 6 [Nematostella vectensis]|uniref:major facilitator superfamily domain-containing protein 6 n=1 Tax=Nematostella vectensis TaxID=45351 RepID=UPI0020774F97|nr:major facilitator superfamily domain-containing protein 6 [Nematostella vectensis]
MSIRSNIREFFSIDASTVKYKIFFVLHFFGLGSIPLYLPVFLRSIGIDAFHSGIIIALRKLVRIPSSPLIGAIADKSLRHKLTLMVCVVLGTCLYSGLSYIPIVQGMERNGYNLSEDEGSQAIATETVHLSIHGRLSTQVIFATALFFVVSGEFFNDPLESILAASIVNQVGVERYGHQRLYGAFGFGIGSLVTGFAMDQTSHVTYIPGSLPHHGPNFLTAFIINFGLSVFALLLIGFTFEITINEKKIPPNFAKHIGLLIRKETVLFLIILFITGVANGVIMSFLFWFLRDIGASQTLLGLVTVVMCSAEMLVFSCTGTMIGRLGHVGVIILALACTIIRLLIYPFLENPWYVLLVEPMNGITFAAMWATCVSYASILAPNEVQSTMQGVVSSVYYNLGGGTGSLLGGMVYKAYGPRSMFWATAGLCGVGMPLAIALYCINSVKEKISNGYELVNEDENLELPLALNDANIAR